jgi:hypothetical protein
VKKTLPQRYLSEPRGRGIARNGAALDECVAAILGFLAGDPERFERFLALTGLSPANLRAATRSAGFAENLLDYLCGDEPLLLAFSEETGYAPEHLMRLRAALAPHPDDP